MKAKYDAWDEDIAMVNIFFGKETVLGKGSPFLKNGPFKGALPVWGREGVKMLARMIWGTFLFSPNGLYPVF